MMIRKTQSLALILCLSLSSCSSTNPPTFITYTQQKIQQKNKAGGAFDPRQPPRPTDALALNYANYVETLFRSAANGSRFAGEGSDLSLAGLSATAAGAKTLAIGASGVSSLGLASGGIVALRTIVDAKGRAIAYSEAAQRIHSAVKDYGAHNLNDVSEKWLTPNGWTLVNVVQSNIDIVNKIVYGRLPKPQALEQASEKMTSAGATQQKAGIPPVNNIPAASIGNLTATKNGVAASSKTTTGARFRVEGDTKYINSVKDLEERLSMLSDIDAIKLDQDMLGKIAKDGKEAKDDLVLAFDLLEKTKNPGRVSDWDKVLPKKTGH
jgi:hypothetical protein